LLLAGVKINQYIAIEGRYLNSFNDLKLKNKITDSQYTLPDSEIESYGIYAKPMYPVTDKVDIYGLLGYANVKISDAGGKFMNDGGFSWGAGASYSVTDRLGVFVDFARLYDDTYDGVGFWSGFKVKVDSINVGLTYTF
ncbi:MAG: porin family protein, partial [Thermoleophilia bacterium]|nr:porin family protein [Thermoleophilia bacterium]